MSQPVLRRPAVPRLHARLPCQSALPTFLMEDCALPMTPAPVMGPQDRLEAAIMQGQVWDAQADPVEFDSFDAEEEVISVILEESDGNVQLEVLEVTGGMEILANGKPMAKVACDGQTVVLFEYTRAPASSFKLRGTQRLRQAPVWRSLTFDQQRFIHTFPDAMGATFFRCNFARPWVGPDEGAAGCRP